MKNPKIKTYLLVGTPNSGKTTLFNSLTGLHKKTGNYPGITVGKNIGELQVEDTLIRLIDLPGTYTLIPNSDDEEITTQTLLEYKDKIDGVLFVGSVKSLPANLFLLSQLNDLGVPALFVINMIDELDKNLALDCPKLSERIGIPVLPISAKKNIGLEELKKALLLPMKTGKKFLPTSDENLLREILNNKEKFHKTLTENIKKRHKQIDKILEGVYKKEAGKHLNKIDKFLLHNVFGYVFFAFVLFSIFQFVFHFASYPMDWIDAFFGSINEYLKSVLPENTFTAFLTDGLITGINGVLIFVPQIAILFFFIIVMEESGYMSRVIFLMDKLMKPFGMNGKSVVPLLAGTACAVPAILSTRNIPNKKQRLITLLAVPFITCSARLPVYVMIISLVIPEKNILGIFNLQGLVFFGLYLLGVFAALVSGAISKFLLRSKYQNHLIIELPEYRFATPKHIAIQVWDKTRSFVVEAGKIIVVLSIIIWFLSTHTPGSLSRTSQIEETYLGKAGQFIEPVLKPLGYDWKIGIGIISSFAAREVFVSTLGIIYEVKDAEETPKALKEKLSNAINENTGKPLFTLASGLSLLVFYAFAMQCMSTLAVIKQETRSLRLTLWVFLYMTLAAYLFAFLTYQIFR